MTTNETKGFKFYFNALMGFLFLATAWAAIAFISGYFFKLGYNFEL